MNEKNKQKEQEDYIQSVGNVNELESTVIETKETHDTSQTHIWIIQTPMRHASEMKHIWTRQTVLVSCSCLQ